MTNSIGALPSALASGDQLAARLRGKHLAVFLDYDGTLTPIVERPDLAVLSEAMRAIVRSLAERCSVAVVSGRDRPDVEKLVGIDTLIFAGSHGFDIASPDGRSIQRDEGASFAGLLEEVTARLHEVMDPIDGALIEPKKASVAAHYRLIAEDQRHKVKDVVDEIIAAHHNLRVTPGKMVYEIQPKLDWNKGKAVLYLLDALGLDGDDVMPMYLGDDVTDEDAFAALKGRGIGVFVGDAADPEVVGRTTDGDYRLADVDEVGQFLDTLGRE